MVKQKQVENLVADLAAITGTAAVSVKASTASSQAFAPATPNNIIYGIEDYDDFGMHNPGDATKITATYNGTHHLLAQVSFSNVSVGGGVLIQIKKNASNFIAQYTDSLKVGANILQIDAEDKCIVGDFYEVFVTVAIAGTLSGVAADNYFAAIRVTNKGAVGPEGNGYLATSPTSHDSSTGGTITLHPNGTDEPNTKLLAYTVGSRMKATSVGNPAIFFETILTAFNPTTGLATFGTPYNFGAGTANDWAVSLTGAKGIDGTGAGSTQRARVFNSAVQSAGANATTTLNFDSESFDSSNIHSTSTNTNRLTIQKDGTYIILGQIGMAASTGHSFNVRIVKNGSTILGQSKERVDDLAASDGSETSFMECHVIDQAVAGDFYTLQVVLVGSAVNIAAGNDTTWFACADLPGVGANGRGISSVAIDINGDLIITYTDATTQNAGSVEYLWQRGAGSNSIQMKGSGCHANGVDSLASGLNAVASGAQTVSIGNNTDAFGEYSQSFGKNTRSEGNSSHAIGESSLAKNTSEFAVGGGDFCQFGEVIYNAIIPNSASDTIIGVFKTQPDSRYIMKVDLILNSQYTIKRSEFIIKTSGANTIQLWAFTDPPVVVVGFEGSGPGSGYGAGTPYFNAEQIGSTTGQIDLVVTTLDGGVIQRAVIKISYIQIR